MSKRIFADAFGDSFITVDEALQHMQAVIEYTRNVKKHVADMPGSEEEVDSLFWQDLEVVESYLRQRKNKESREQRQYAQRW